jgi:hypothetical protein
MALPDLDKSVGHSFDLEFDGIQIKQIQEVSGLKLSKILSSSSRTAVTAST